MSELEIKTEYRGVEEIAKRLNKGPEFIRRLIKQKDDSLPVKIIGREYWITEKKLQEWLNS
jgi:excisionase family DNA binding protein